MILFLTSTKPLGEADGAELLSGLESHLQSQLFGNLFVLFEDALSSTVKGRLWDARIHSLWLFEVPYRLPAIQKTHQSFTIISIIFGMIFSEGHPGRIKLDNITDLLLPHLFTNKPSRQIICQIFSTLSIAHPFFARGFLSQLIQLNGIFI
ncbi:Uncharacterised protein [uncultured archaeon]|nr:Uncharacterised protein [uncultured archaeon]